MRWLSIDHGTKKIGLKPEGRHLGLSLLQGLHLDRRKLNGHRKKQRLPGHLSRKIPLIELAIEQPFMRRVLIDDDKITSPFTQQIERKKLADQDQAGKILGRGWNDRRA